MEVRQKHSGLIFGVAHWNLLRHIYTSVTITPLTLHIMFVCIRLDAVRLWVLYSYPQAEYGHVNYIPHRTSPFSR